MYNTALLIILPFFHVRKISGGTIKMAGQTLCRAHILPQIHQKHIARGTALTGAPRSPSRGLQTSEGREKSPCNWVRARENPRARKAWKGPTLAGTKPRFSAVGERAALAHGPRPATAPAPGAARHPGRRRGRLRVSRDYYIKPERDK